MGTETAGAFVVSVLRTLLLTVSTFYHHICVTDIWESVTDDFTMDICSLPLTCQANCLTIRWWNVSAVNWSVCSGSVIPCIWTQPLQDSFKIDSVIKNKKGWMRMWANSHSHLWAPVTLNLTLACRCMSRKWEGKLEYLQGTYAKTGRTWKLHTGRIWPRIHHSTPLPP